MKKVTYNNTSDNIFLCDMRPGFTEDGLSCALPRGNFTVEFQDETSDGARGFSLVLTGESPDIRCDLGELSVDMARVGVVDRQAFLAHFGDDPEALFEWSDDAVDPALPGAAEIVHEDNSELRALVVNVGCDGNYQVQTLHDGERLVGVALTPIQPERKADGVSRHTRVDVKFAGIGDPWEFFDDWNYEPEHEDVLEALFDELVICPEIIEGNYSSSDDIDPNSQLKQYVERFAGVMSIQVFIEIDDGQAKKIPIPESFAIPEFTAETTFRELSDVIFSIVKNARSWAASIE